MHRSRTYTTHRDTIWRRKALAKVKARTETPAFAVVAVEAEEDDSEGGTVVLVIGKMTLWIGPEVTPRRITEVIRAIRAA